MSTAYLVVALMAIGANAFSGVAAIVHFKPIIPAMARAGVPESWLTFPIGTLKTAGAAGLLAVAVVAAGITLGVRGPAREGARGPSVLRGGASDASLSAP